MFTPTSASAFTPSVGSLIDENRLATDDAYCEDMRHRCETDLFFLSEIIRPGSFRPDYHQDAVDLYFPKNRKLSIQQQHPIKNRLHLDPRKTRKTTLGRMDKLQWILAFPEIITILNESASHPLAKAISQGIANYFCQYKIVTPIQRLYPELVVSQWPFHNDKETWNTPIKELHDLDSTIAFTSPASKQSGWHPWVINADDMVETGNSGIHAKDEIRRKVIDTFDTNRNTLQGGGYMYLIGTRYHPFDLYGVRLEDMDPTKWKVLVRQSLTVKSGAPLVPGEFPDEEDMILHFPELPDMDYAGLRETFHASYESFMCQQQNSPQGGNVPIFTEQMYASCETAVEHVPPYGGETYTCWRLPCGKKGMEDAAGVAARVLDGRVYAIDSWQGNWIPSKLAERMVLAHKKTQADAMMILATPGSEYMTALVRNEAARKNVSIRIQWVDWESADELRRQEIRQLEPLMKVGRLTFSTGMTKAKECRRQFVHFGLVEDTGIIECVSKLANLVPVSQMRANLEEEELSYQRQRRDDATINWLLAQQGMPRVDEQARQKAAAHQQAMQQATTYRLPPMPGGLDG
jgi:hypothetical protein